LQKLRNNRAETEVLHSLVGHKSISTKMLRVVSADLEPAAKNLYFFSKILLDKNCHF